MAVDPMVPPTGQPSMLIISGAYSAVQRLIKFADVSVDCRKFPNPFNHNHLRLLDGLQPDVRHWCWTQRSFVTALKAFTSDLVQVKLNHPGRLVVGVSYCVGGRHRSPAMGLEALELLAKVLVKNPTLPMIEYRRVPYRMDKSYQTVQPAQMVDLTHFVARVYCGQQLVLPTDKEVAVCQR